MPRNEKLLLAKYSKTSLASFNASLRLCLIGKVLGAVEEFILRPLNILIRLLFNLKSIQYLLCLSLHTLGYDMLFFVTYLSV